MNMNKGHDILRGKKLKRLEIAEEEAKILLKKFSCNQSVNLAILTMIYECEGGKDDKGINFSNSDPGLIIVFLSTLRSLFKVDENRLHALVHIHDYHDEDEIIKYWSSVTNIPVHRFYKSFKKPSDHKFKKADYKGCLHIYYGDIHVYRVIRAVAKKLIKLYI